MKLEREKFSNKYKQKLAFEKKINNIDKPLARNRHTTD